METVKRLLADIDAFAPTIHARADQIEASSRVPIDLIEALKSIGVFRMFAPGSHDGLELGLPSIVDVISHIGRINGSVGWVSMIGCSSGLFLPSLPGETYEHIYRNGPDLIMAGSAKPAGTAEAVDGGFRVSGRWPFASGCQHADLIVCFCIVTRNGVPLPGPAGTNKPQVRAFVLPASDFRIEDTWHVAGLRGTGSHDITLDDVVIPRANAFDPMAAEPCQPGPLCKSVLHVLPLMHGANSVGMAGGALDELVALARTGRQQLGAGAPMQQSELFQWEVGRSPRTSGRRGRCSRPRFTTTGVTRWPAHSATRPG
jgi:indole-3-acetate monooxygenase